MIRQLGDLYAWLLGWPLLAPLHKGLFYLSARAMGLQNFASEAVSGESRAAASCLAGKTSPVVFDVGANEGNWLSQVLRLAPDARLHAFEPQPALAERIRVRAPGVFVTNAAVGERQDRLTLYDYADHPGSSHASLLPGVIDGVHRGLARTTEVPVIRLDDYCKDRSIEAIDLLKIDVEGFELSVLRGAQRLLASGKVAAIQFEFNEMNVVGRTFLRDFFQVLGPDYRLYRVLPHGLLPLRNGSAWLNEQFVFQNVLALRAA